ncbi:MAG: peptide-methionine (S)-S-oxide reductase MsrA [Erysipelotrichaceae bacterium]
MKKIVLAGGCFWGVEEYYRRLKGVETTRVGYAQGIIVNPSYEDVCSGETNHAEVVEIGYDEQVISLELLINHLFRICDPCSLNRQGHDVGTQYRVGIYSSNQTELDTIKKLILAKQALYTNPIVLEVEILRDFYDAESYHQKYLVKNPGGYCHVNMNLIKAEEKK